MKCLSLVILALLALGASGCREKVVEPAPAAAVTTNRPTANSPDVKLYVVRGVVKKVDAADQTVSIEHEAIPNYMPTMTMPFKVKDLKDLAGLQPGDTIWFRLCVAPNESWIDKVTKEKKPAEPAPQAKAPEREPVRVARDVEPLKVGEVMPDYRFTNELGRTINLADFRGQALAFTFIFTRCPLPEFCPRMSRNFAEVCQKLLALPNGPTNWHLLTISFDPHFDTPAVLRGYAQAFQNDPERWNFVTGAMIDIDAITDQFELIIVKRGNEWDHKVRTVVVDANGRIQKIIYGNEWKPDALVEEIVKAANVKPPLAANTEAARQ
jgi:protein SCO1